MLVRDKRRFTLDDALGPRNAGVVSPGLDEKQRETLWEYRNDLGLAEQGVGMQFVPDAPEPWLNPNLVKLNLGSYRDFSARGWFNVAGPNDPKRAFNAPLDQLKLKEASVDFIYAPFVVETLPNPVQAARYWRDSLKPGGALAVVINDRDKLIQQGRPFGNTRFGAAELRRILEDAGFDAAMLGAIDFGRFSLAGNDPGHSGYVAAK